MASSSTTTDSPPGPASPPSLPDRPTAGRALGAAVATTAAVTLVSYVARDYAAMGVGIVFCAAVGWFVLRHDTNTICHYGLSLGGFLEPQPIEWRSAGMAALRAVAWAAAFALVLFPPFAWGFRVYWHVVVPFRWTALHLGAFGDEALGQLLVVALPEEAFYRGYLMTALDDVWGTPWRVGGARLGWGLIVSCAIFALGHVLTQPDPGRLAVFFPALLFGWLRARTRGIGAGFLLHAMCNLLSSTLARGYSSGMH